MAAVSVVDFLAHYGVKGMKWGVRNDRKEIMKNWSNASVQVAENQNAHRMKATLNESSYSKLNDDDVIVTKDSQVKRVSANPYADRFNENLFVSTNAEDANTYRGLLASGGYLQKEYAATYETTYRAVSELKSPSEKKRVDAYITLMDTPDIQLHNESITGREYLKRQGLGDTVDKLSSRELALTYYGQLAVNQGIKNEPINTAYFNELKKKGYNALVDDNDRNVISKTPLLVLDSYKHLEEIHVKQLTTEEIHTAQGTLKIPRYSAK